jgi:hypothetical protein
MVTNVEIPSMGYPKAYNAAVVEAPNPEFKYAFSRNLDLFQNGRG